MNKELTEVKKKLLEFANKERAMHSLRFFKTGKGEYAEGDKFLGLTVPQIRVLSRTYAVLPTHLLEQLLQSDIHEERLLSLLILVNQFKVANQEKRKQIYELYIHNTKWINNWDLVDSSASWIVGGYLQGEGIEILKMLAKSELLWERRIAIIATLFTIKKNNPKDTLVVAELLVQDRHDLIQKAVGWMLREVGKASGEEVEEVFLKKYASTMPRTMLRYSIERFPKQKKEYYMNLKNMHS